MVMRAASTASKHNEHRSNLMSWQHPETNHHIPREADFFAVEIFPSAHLLLYYVLCRVAMGNSLSRSEAFY